MLFLRIKQAEAALSDGRLDEAFALAGTDDFRAHYRGQQVIGKLARALVERGQRHLTDRRDQDALADCEKACRLAGNLAEAAELRAAVLAALAGQRHRERAQNDAVAAAKQHLEVGQLSLAGRTLEAADAASTRVGALAERIETLRERAAAGLARSEQALQLHDYSEAVRALVEVRRTHPGEPRLPELIARMGREVAERVTAALRDGALDLADSLAATTEPLGPMCEIHTLRQRLEQLRTAAGLMRTGRYREAAERLRLLAGLLPDATWIGEAAPRLENAAAELERVRGGPLGLLMPAAGDQIAVPAARVAPADETVRLPNLNDGQREARPAGGMLPNRFLLQADGVGAFLVVRERRVNIGPVSSSRRPEIPLLMDASLPMLTIERNDEDYLLTSDRPVRVNGAAVTRKLLANEDRIALSPRCRLRFTLPNAASPSAVVHISGARMPQSDVRRVILLEQSLVMGPAASAHIRTGQVSAPVVLYARGDRLLCRSPQPVTADGKRLEESDEIVLGARVAVGNLSFVVTPADAS